MQHFDHLVCACSSGVTAAGCVLGAKIPLPQTQVMCSMVDIPVPDLLDMCGSEYSIPSTEANQAIRMMLQLEGIVLDTCYTGKAFTGLIRRTGRASTNRMTMFRLFTPAAFLLRIGKLKRKKSAACRIAEAD